MLNDKNRVGNNDPFDKDRARKEADKARTIAEAQQKINEKKRLADKILVEQRALDSLRFGLAEKEKQLSSLELTLKDHRREVETLAKDMKREEDELISIKSSAKKTSSKPKIDLAKLEEAVRVVRARRESISFDLDKDRSLLLKEKSLIEERHRELDERSRAETSNTKEVDEILTQISSKKSDFDILSRKIDSLRSELATLTREYDALNNDIQALEKSVIQKKRLLGTNTGHDLVRLRADIAEDEKGISLLEKQISKGEKELALKSNEEHQLEENLNLMRKEQSVRGEQSDAVEGAYEIKSRALADIKTRLGDRERQVTVSESYASAMKGEIFRMRNEIAKKDAEMSKDKEDLYRREREISDIERRTK